MVDPKSQPTHRRRGTKRMNASRTKRNSSIPGARRSDPESFAGNQRRYEHYISLARNAASSGDVIEAENLYQHAEHYLREIQG
jgi:hypothetical protein